MSDGHTAIPERDLEIPLTVRRRLFVRLADLPDPEGDPRGLRTRLGHITAPLLRTLREMEADPEGKGELVWEVGAALFPDLTRDQVDRVDPADIHAAIQVLMTPIQDLERIAKNGNAPLAEAPKGSRSRTPSPTRSRGSRRATASDSAT